MSTFDSPDWQNVVTLSSGPVSDAPDWQEVIVGPGGTPISGGGGATSWVPGDFGWAGWTCSLIEVLAQNRVVSGQINLAFMRASTSATVTHIVLGISTPASSGQTANENFVGIYSAPLSGGVPGAPQLLAVSATGAADAPLKVKGFQAIPLSAGLAVTAGTIYYGALLHNASSDSLELNVFEYSAGTTGFQGLIMPLGQMPQVVYTGPNTSLPGSLAAPVLADFPPDSPWMAMY